MNERIFTELYKKAWGHFPCPTGEPELEKFAELLIRECAKVSERTGALNEADFEGEMIADAIKEHFGIEESV